MKYLFVLFLLLTALTSASAHVVLTDGAIGVTMHIDPDDAPVAGSPSRFEFWFKDTTGHLDPAQCKGTFTVANADNFLVTSQPLFARVDTGLISVHEVTFPKPGVYTVRVNGASKGAVTFQPFLIEFKVRVTGEKSWLLQNWFILVLCALIAAVIVWVGLRPLETGKKKGS